MIDADRALPPSQAALARIVSGRGGESSSDVLAALDRWVAEIRAQAPWLEPADELLLDRAARDVAALEQLWRQLERAGVIGPHGWPWTRTRLWTKLRRAATRSLLLVGLAPASRRGSWKDLGKGRLRVRAIGERPGRGSGRPVAER